MIWCYILAISSYRMSCGYLPLYTMHGLMNSKLSRMVKCTIQYLVLYISSRFDCILCHVLLLYHTLLYKITNCLREILVTVSGSHHITAPSSHKLFLIARLFTAYPSHYSHDPGTHSTDLLLITNWNKECRKSHTGSAEW